MILIFHCWWVTLDFALSDCLRIAEVRLGPIIQKEERVIDLLPRLCTIVCANKKEITNWSKNDLVCHFFKFIKSWWLDCFGGVARVEWLRVAAMSCCDFVALGSVEIQK